jgi:protein phosphatase
MDVKAYGLTDVGRQRQHNEDTFLVADEAKLFLVADGMGGHAAGEQASALVVAAIERFALNTLKWFLHSSRADTERILSEFRSALAEADAQILHEAVEHPKLAGMGTTLTMAYHIDRQLCVAHVGDSRAYLHRGDDLQQITHDHTVTAEMVRLGQLRPEEVIHHRLRHMITNVVGGPQAGVFVEAHALGLRPGDRLMLCSDGLTEMLSHEVIADTLEVNPEPEPACTSLLRQANEAGGRDNITVVVADFNEPVG